jgi:hypothetical protein
LKEKRLGMKHFCGYKIGYEPKPSPFIHYWIKCTESRISGEKHLYRYGI